MDEDTSDGAPSDSGRPTRSPRLGLPRQRRKALRFLLIAAAALGIYALCGFYLAPWLLRREAVSAVRERYGRQLRIGDVHVQPFALSLEIRGLRLLDRDGSGLVSSERVFVDFEAFASLWQRAYVFREISIEHPHVRAVKRRGGAFNLAELAAAQGRKDNAQAGDGAESALPRVWVQDLRIQAGGLEFEDQDRAQVFSETLSPLGVRLKNFRTVPQRGSFGITAALAGGGSVHWYGDVALRPEISSFGTLSVSDLPLNAISNYLTDRLPFRIAHGTASLHGRYHFRLGSERHLELQVADVRVNGLALRAHGEAESWVRIPEIQVTNVDLLMPENQVQTEHLLVQGASVQAWLSEDRTLNLQRLFARTSAHSQRRAREGSPKGRPSPWTGTIAHVEVRGAKADFEDRAIAPGTQFQVSELDLRAEDVRLDPARPIAFEARLAVNQESRLRAKGRITPRPSAAELEIELEHIQLALAQPYLAPYLALVIDHGFLDAHGKLTKHATSPQGELSFAGDLTLHDLETRDTAGGQDFVNLETLEVRGIRASAAPATLSIAQVNLEKPFARVVLHSDQTLNLVSVLAPERARAASHAAAAQESAPEDAARPPAKSPPAGGMMVRVDEVQFEAMRVDFADYFVRPNFAAEIGHLHGTIRGLSSDPRSRARVSLEGRIGDSSPVTFSGQVQPFAFDKFTDLTLHSENISLPVFNPYSGRFAGYNIDEGELSTDIHYQVQNRNLSADHALRIDQLRWGERSGTKQGAPLPVKLATALLRDRHGVISLDLPIQGTLDDPKFRVWPLVWQVLGNVFVKAATAPFELLASAFKGAEKARFVEFSPGSAELEQETHSALTSLSHALSERPGLKLEVPLGVAPPLDRIALLEQKYQETLARTIARTQQEQGQAGVAPAYEDLAPAEKFSVLSAAYRELSGRKPKLVNAPPPPKEATPKGAKVWQRAYQLETLEAETRGKIVVSASDLEDLGRRRAEAIERALTGSTPLESERVLLTKQGKVEAEHGKVRLELQLK